MRRTVDIVISALVGGIVGGFVGATIVAFRPIPSAISVDSLAAKRISVGDYDEYISIDDSGISLRRSDYATALLWFREPGTGSPGSGGPVLWISGKEGELQAFKATPSGEGMVPLKRDEGDGR